MRNIYCLYGDNHTVTDFYMDVIAEAFTQLGYTVKELTLKEPAFDKSAIVIVPTALDLWNCYKKGFRDFVMWSQGTIPEESYMRHHSRIKWAILSLLEWWGLKKAKLNLFVSEAQQQHFEKMYHLNLRDNGYVMPCYNCELTEKPFETPGKYEKNIFAYTGSFIAPWQFIDGNLRFYKNLEDKYGDKVFLKILTPHQDVAKEKMKEYGIQNFSIGCVKPEVLPDAIADAKFGLLLREDNIVNNIATPTKLSSYMSCGLIPVVSDCIKDYAKHMSGKDFFALVNNSLDTKNVEDIIEKNIQGKHVYKSFKEYWVEQYNTTAHIEKIKSLILKHFI